MLCLSRRIDDAKPEWVNIHINYADNTSLRQLVERLGGNVRMLDNIVDSVKVQAIDYRQFANGNEVVLGFEGPRHVVFCRSEIDAM